MKVSLILPFLFLFSSLFAQQSETLESKGAIIIASLEGQVIVTNNDTQAQLPSSQVKAGGLLFDGHTVKTGPASKVILLLSNGTVSTIKADSALNIKKFTQEKFDPGRKKLSEMKGEPSSSQTVLDLELGDMVLDVKKLDKKSSFNIESPVGTAGIRGTVPHFQVSQTSDGGFNQVTSMLKGELAFTPIGTNKSTFLGPGQSLSIGVGPNGILLPPSLGRVSQSLLTSIEADIEASGNLTGVSSTEDTPLPPSGSGQAEDDEAEQQEQNNDADPSKSAKSAGADSNGSATLGAMSEQNLINPKSKNAGVAVEAMEAAADIFVATTDSESVPSSPGGAQRNRRNSDDGTVSAKGSSNFLTDLVDNFSDVVDVTAEADELGIDKSVMFESLLENSENSGAVKDVVAVAGEIGTKDKSNMLSVFTNVDQADSIKEVLDTSADLGLQDASNLTAVFNNADKADDLKSVMDVAKKALGSDDGSGSNKLDTSSASILASTLQNADQADQLNEVMEASADLGLQDASNLTAVFSNADKASDLKAVMDVAKETLGSGESGSKK
ncbi:FecR family protein, partial [Opitutales bacterium]|nr:FecR family protein [Opitutales bacterium]